MWNTEAEPKTRQGTSKMFATLVFFLFCYQSFCSCSVVNEEEEEVGTGLGMLEPVTGFCNRFREAMISAKLGLNLESLIIRTGQLRKPHCRQGCYRTISHKRFKTVLIWGMPLVKMMWFKHYYFTYCWNSVQESIYIYKYAYVCQHLLMISAIAGSTKSGMSRRRCWNPTAPTTCIAFIFPHGCCSVKSSHRITP